MRLTTWMIPMLSLGLFIVETAQSYGQFGGYPVNPQYNRPNRIFQPTQPLPPFLNLFRGGIPAVNYFYDVRPALQEQRPLGFGMPMLPVQTPRQSFFPQVQTLQELSRPATATPSSILGTPSGLSPTGQGGTFNNTLGYYGNSPSVTRPPAASAPAEAGTLRLPR